MRKVLLYSLIAALISCSDSASHSEKAPSGGSRHGDVTVSEDVPAGYHERYTLEKEIADDVAHPEHDISRDPQSWDSEDVEGLYVYLDGVDDEDEAQAIADEYYEGDLIREGWDYFAKIGDIWGEYEVSLDARLSEDFYRISGMHFRGRDVYVRFEYLPAVSAGDEGLLDCSGLSITFYIRPE